MHARRTCPAVATIALAIAYLPSARAQFIDACVNSPMMGMGAYDPSSAKGGAPFNATVKTTFEQKLPEGNAIRRVTHTHQARDSAGRTMIEAIGGCVHGEDGEMRPLIVANVNDPIARTRLNWIVNENGQPKVANLMHFPDSAPRAPIPQAARPAPDPAQQAQRLRVYQAQQARLRAENHTEDLGTRDFNGIAAQGTRTTRTIPAGEEGNDQPLVVFTETWRSKELGLTVMAIDDDPRRGRTTTEYEDLNLGEPDPSLFAPPPGYTIKEQPQPGIVGTAN